MPSTSPATGRWAAAILALLGLATALYQVVIDNTPKGSPVKIENYTPWPGDIVDRAEDLPVQDGGRIKPLSTYAGFTMLSLHGARSMKITGKDGSESKLKPMHWLLDTLFRPAIAIQLPTFRVDNSDAIRAIGLEPKDRRDRYSYAELQPGRVKLGELFQAYQGIEPKRRDAVQQQIITLGQNLNTYESLLGYFTFARNGVTLVGSGDENTPDKRADTSAILATAPLIREQIGDSAPGSPHLSHLLDQVHGIASYASTGLFLIPPTDPDHRQWLSAGGAISRIMEGKVEQPEPYIEDIRAMETVARDAFHNEPDLADSIRTLKTRLTERAQTRGEANRIALEAAYYHINWFLYAMVWYLLGTVSALFMWLFGRNLPGKIAWWTTTLSTVAGLVYCIIAIVKRCLIMQRPPIGNLYDTIIFIATTIVLLSLLIEWLSRRRFALGLAPIIGGGLVILARRFELGDASDHMDPLVAVLNSNYWLTTHVITITLGYSAGLLTAFLSAVYVLMRGLRLADSNHDLLRQLTRSVYGMTCFTLFLALVGTVLGGIWANDSWGRFWGWDPKENGALMIVLWTLAILHARLGGFLKEWGLHLASLFTAIVITFSWWHVNFLGVGLHNYGFTAGKGTIGIFYGAVACLILFGAVSAMLSKPGPSPRASAD